MLKGASPQPVYRAGECEVDFARRELRVRGKPVPIGMRALQILGALAKSAGGMASKEDLFDAVWPGAVVNDNTLQAHISAIRKVLAPIADCLKRKGGAVTGSWGIGARETTHEPSR